MIFFHPSLGGISSGYETWGGTRIPILGLLWTDGCGDLTIGWPVKFTIPVSNSYLNS